MVYMVGFRKKVPDGCKVPDVGGGTGFAAACYCMRFQSFGGTEPDENCKIYFWDDTCPAIGGAMIHPDTHRMWNKWNITLACWERVDAEHGLPRPENGQFYAGIGSTVLSEHARRALRDAFQDDRKLYLNDPAAAYNKYNPLAYVSYTSGSTGKPKGVCVTHNNMMSTITAFQKLCPLKTDDILLAVTTFSFDISVLELWWPIAVGARLAIAPDHVTKSGKKLIQAIRLCNATVLQATPFTWRLLTNAIRCESQPLSIRTALCGGETFPPQLVDPLLALVGDEGVVYNCYGPTETTIWSSAYQVTREDRHLERIPIGRPLQGERFTVLADGLEHNISDPDGLITIGELIIGGTGVSRGYHSQGDDQSDKFLVDWEWQRGAGQRWFRTGDMCSVDQRTKIYVFLGRLDGQVKVRGVRIELGEVEFALGDGSCVVIMDWERPFLRAFLTYGEGNCPSKEELESKGRSVADVFLPICRKLLASNMIPLSFEAVDRLPTSSAGKVDRLALQQIPLPAATAKRYEELNREEDGDGGDAHEEKPVGFLEAVLAACRCMGLADEISPDTDFFALGFDSLSQIVFVEQLQKFLPSGNWSGIEDGIPAMIWHHTPIEYATYLRKTFISEGLEIPDNWKIADEAFLPFDDDANDMERSVTADINAPLKQKRTAGRGTMNRASEPDVSDPGLKACRDGDLETLKILLEGGGWSPSVLGPNGSNGVHYAASGGHLEVLKFLVFHAHADLFYADKKSGRTALHWAARQGHVETMKWLVEKMGFGVEAACKDGTTACHLAAWGGFVPAVEYLTQKGANPSALNKYVCHCAHFASLAGQLEMCKWLHANGVDMTFGNQQDHNALHKAAYGGHKEVCEWLQDVVGIDPTAELLDKNGQSPVRLAEKARHPELGEWLKRHRKEAPTGYKKAIPTPTAAAEKQEVVAKENKSEQKDDDISFVFVYGTLKKNFKNYNKLVQPHLKQSRPADPSLPWARLLCGQAVVEDVGWLFVDAYYIPFCVFSSDGENSSPIHGEVYRVNNVLLKILDDLEGVAENRYQRIEVPIVVGKSSKSISAWMYGLSEKPNLEYVPSKDFPEDRKVAKTGQVEVIEEYNFQEHRKYFVPQNRRDRQRYQSWGGYL